MVTQETCLYIKLYSLKSLQGNENLQVNEQSINALAMNLLSSILNAMVSSTLIAESLHHSDLVLSWCNVLIERDPDRRGVNCHIVAASD